MSAYQSKGFSPPLVPASFFGIVLGLAGLGNAWRAAHLAWGLPREAGEAILGLAAITWAVLIVLYAMKWIFARDAALAEANHAVQCCFIGLAGVSTMLIAMAALPYSHPVAVVLYAAGALFTLGFALWRTGILWQGGRDANTTTAVLYLPTVAGGFVTAMGAAALGYHELAQLAFGAGALSWLAIESVLLRRLYTGAALPPALRPTLGIQLAPPNVGAAAYLAINGGAPDLVVHTLLGYGILQALLLLRLAPWLLEAGFGAGFWAFSFGATALAGALARLVAHGDTGLIAALAAPVFIAVNLLILAIALGTISLLAKGKLLPAAPKPATT